jgi:hypothetical protein
MIKGASVMSFKDKIKKTASYITPWRSVSRAGRQVADSGRGIAEAARSAFSSIREKRRRDVENAKVEAEVLRAQDGATPAQLYEASIEHRGWTPEEEQRQRAARRLAKWGWWAGYALAMVNLCLAIISGSSLWLMSASVCAVVSTLFLPPAAAREAHIEWQIARREILPFSVFVGERDFFRRVIL